MPIVPYSGPPPSETLLFLHPPEWLALEQASAHRRAMLRIANLLFWRSLREESSEPQTDPLE
jgi:hypothetical protein